MAQKSYQNRDFGFGLNAFDAEHAMGDQYGVVHLNTVVGTGFVETRNGLTLFNEDNAKSGGITAMAAYYDRAGAKRLAFAHDDDYYFLPNTAATDTAWTSYGDYGTAVNNPFIYQYQNGLAFGTGLAANGQKKALATTLSAVTTQADTSSDIRFFEYHQGANVAYLLGGGNARDNATHNNSTGYYTTDIDDWSTGGTILVGGNDGQDLTAVKSHGNIMWYKESSAYRADIVYESNSGTNVMRILERFQDVGAINQEVCQVALNDIISLSQRHGFRGFGQVQTALGGSQSRRYSTKIKPLLDKVDWDTAKTTARSIVWNDKIFCAVPIDSSTNNAVFVGHLDLVTDIGEVPWTLFDIAVGSFEIFQNSNGIEKLFIGDANSPKIYIWDEKSLSDNQANISTRFRTKKLDLGDLEFDEQDNVILAGQMSEPTRIKATVFVDGISTDYYITSEQIVNSTDPIWSHIIGSEIVGGNSQDASRPRWLAVLPLPDSHRVGSEMQIEISSIGSGYYWKLDYLSINEGLNENLYPDNHFVDAET